MIHPRATINHDPYGLHTGELPRCGRCYDLAIDGYFCARHGGKGAQPDPFIHELVLKRIAEREARELAEKALMSQVGVREW